MLFAKPESESQPEQPMSLNGRRIAFVGKLGSMNRRDAKELVRRHGGEPVDAINASVDVIVIGADVLPMEDTDELLSDDVLAAAAEGRVEVIRETQLWQHLGLVDAQLDVAQLYTPAMLADLLDLPISTIRRWQRCQLIRPARQVKQLAYFDFQEVASARRIARLVAAGASPEAMERKLTKLAELYPDLQRPLSQLSVLVEGQSILLRQGEGLIEPGGQKRLNFGLEEAPGRAANPILSFEEATNESLPDRYSTPQDMLNYASELEDSGHFDSAIEVYRAYGLAFGPSAEVSFRLGELLYQRHDLNGARERYYMAVELDDSFVEARGSLGCVLVELGEWELARSAFEGALDHHPDYPDVHFHLARLLDDLGESDTSEVHWTKFIQLAPQSPWSAEARQRLDSDPSTETSI